MKCNVSECNNEGSHRGLCRSHYMRWWRHGDDLPIADLIKAPRGTGCIDSNGYVKVMINGRSTYEHIVLAEKALGKPLPKGAVVHHTDHRHINHGFFKLVICPNNEYHALIHKRMKDLGYENS